MILTQLHTYSTDPTSLYATSNSWVITRAFCFIFVQKSSYLLCLFFCIRKFEDYRKQPGMKPGCKSVDKDAHRKHDCRCLLSVHHCGQIATTHLPLVGHRDWKSRVNFCATHFGVRHMSEDCTIHWMSNVIFKSRLIEVANLWKACLCHRGKRWPIQFGRCRKLARLLRLNFSRVLDFLGRSKPMSNLSIML